MYHRSYMLWHFKKMLKNMQKTFIDIKIFIVTYATYELKKIYIKILLLRAQMTTLKKKAIIRKCLDILSKVIIFSCQSLAYVESFCRPFLRIFLFHSWRKGQSYHKKTHCYSTLRHQMRDDAIAAIVILIIRGVSEMIYDAHVVYALLS